MRLKYSKLYRGDHNTDTHSLGGMFLSNMGTPRASAMPSFNTIKGLEAFKAFGRFMSTSGGTEEVESEMQCLIKKNSLIIIIMTIITMTMTMMTTMMVVVVEVVMVVMMVVMVVVVMVMMMVMMMMMMMMKRSSLQVKSNEAIQILKRQGILKGKVLTSG